MDVYSWFRRSVPKLKKTSTTGPADKSSREDEEDKLYGISDQLIEFIKTFSLDTFNSFSLPDEEQTSDGGNSGNGSVRTDLSDWQETHAMLILSRVKELAQLRFRLCPRYLKEGQFWRVYFTLVRNFVAEYERHAVRLAKLKQMRMGSVTVSDDSAYEVEMSEAKFALPEESINSLE